MFIHQKIFSLVVGSPIWIKFDSLGVCAITKQGGEAVRGPDKRSPREKNLFMKKKQEIGRTSLKFQKQ
jgi:hypothetical protein